MGEKASFQSDQKEETQEEVIAKEFHDLYFGHFLTRPDINLLIEKFSWDKMGEPHQEATVFAFQQLVEKGRIQITA